MAVEVTFRRARGDVIGVYFCWLRNELVGRLRLRRGLSLLG